MCSKRQSNLRDPLLRPLHPRNEAGWIEEFRGGLGADRLVWLGGWRFCAPVRIGGRRGGWSRRSCRGDGLSGVGASRPWAAFGEEDRDAHH